MPAPDESALPAICSAAAEAAVAIRTRWATGDPIVVLDPADPPARRAAWLAALGSAPLDPQTGSIVATSGTTGEPRFVVHARAAITASCRAVSAALEVDPARDRWLACLPMHHVAGLAVVLRSAVTGVSLTVHDGFDVDAVARAAGVCTLVSLVPTQLVRLLDAGAPVDRFRSVLLGGGPIPAALLERARGAGVTVHTTYGLSETFGGCVHDGHPLDGVEITLAPDEEILVRGPVVMREYHGDADATRTAFTEDGRLRTGDVGHIDHSGRLHVLDRRRDLVITGGVNVSPTAVEQVLAEHPAVGDACVIGRPDPEWGERVVACVVPDAPGHAPSLAELRAFAADRLARAELPRELVLVRRIPRTASGKPRRAQLRSEVEAASL